MAKKSPSAAPKAAPKASAKAPSAPAKAAAPAAPALSSDAIGAAAGGVWQALHDRGPMTLAALKKGSGSPPDVTLMAVGWLAREGKLGFTASGKTVKVLLK